MNNLNERRDKLATTNFLGGQGTKVQNIQYPGTAKIAKMPKTLTNVDNREIVIFFLHLLK